MKLHPKKTKHRKAFKGRIRGFSKRGTIINFGRYALKSLEHARITENQIEAARKVITKYLKRSGKLWIRLFANVPVTKKPTDVRMGKGKGPVEYYISRVSPGRILFELDNITEAQAKEAFEKATGKLPVSTTFCKSFL